MDNNPLIQHVINLRKSLFDEKFLDRQFAELEALEKIGNPNFVEEVVTIYFRDSANLIANVEHELAKTPIDFARLDKALHQFKGSTTSIGAYRVKIGIMQLRECMKDGNPEACKVAFQQLKSERETLRDKLQTYFQMRRQILPVEIADQPEYKDEDSD